MSVLGLTGGIATGKSTFARLLLRECPMGYFDSDRCVHELLAAEDEVRDEIQKAFGPGVLDSSGRPDRLLLRERVFASDASRRKLEEILHPLVQARWREAIWEARKTNACLLVDIPLLYETGAQGEFDRIIVVACSRETQNRRLTTERRLSPHLAARIVAAQQALDDKIQQADHVIWNDSTVPNLDGQSRLFASWLRTWSTRQHDGNR